MSKLNQPGKSYCLLPGDEIDLDHWSLRVSGQPDKGLSKLRGQAGLSLELRFCKQFRPDKAGCGHSRDLIRQVIDAVGVDDTDASLLSASGAALSLIHI